MPVTFSSITVRKPFGEIASAGREELAAGVVDQHVEPPVALHQPRRRRRRPAPPRGCRGSRARSDPGSSAASSAVSASGSSRRPQPTTVAPRRAISSAVSRPKPLPAPETTTTAPSSRPSLNTCERDAFQPSPASLQSRSAGVLWDRHGRPRRTAAAERAPPGRAGRRHRRGRTADRRPRRLPPRGDGRPGRQLQDAAPRPRDHQLQAGADGPRPRLPDPPPDRRPDPRRHRPPPLDRERRLGELRRPRQPLRPARRSSRAKTCPRSCAPRGSSRARSRSW